MLSDRWNCPYNYCFRCMSNIVGNWGRGSIHFQLNRVKIFYDKRYNLIFTEIIENECFITSKFIVVFIVVVFEVIELKINWRRPWKLCTSMLLQQYPRSTSIPIIDAEQHSSYSILYVMNHSSDKQSCCTARLLTVGICFGCSRAAARPSGNSSRLECVFRRLWCAGHFVFQKHKPQH